MICPADHRSLTKYNYLRWYDNGAFTAWKEFKQPKK